MDEFEFTYEELLDELETLFEMIDELPRADLIMAYVNGEIYKEDVIKGIEEGLCVKSLKMQYLHS